LCSLADPSATTAVAAAAVEAVGSFMLCCAWASLWDSLPCEHATDFAVPDVGVMRQLQWHTYVLLDAHSKNHASLAPGSLDLEPCWCRIIASQWPNTKYIVSTHHGLKHTHLCPFACPYSCNKCCQHSLPIFARSCRCASGRP
jgi:hypothetical protein